MWAQKVEAWKHGVVGAQGRPSHSPIRPSTCSHPGLPQDPIRSYAWAASPLPATAWSARGFHPDFNSTMKMLLAALLEITSCSRSGWWTLLFRGQAYLGV